MAAGVLLALMMRINSSLGEVIGPLESSFVVHLIGTAFAFFLILRHLNKNFIEHLKKVPLKFYSCGLYGVILVLTANIIVPHLGMVLSVTILITASLVSSTFADHFGILQDKKHPVHVSKIVGILCAIGGLLLALKG